MRKYRNIFFKQRVIICQTGFCKSSKCTEVQIQEKNILKIFLQKLLLPKSNLIKVRANGGNGTWEKLKGTLMQIWKSPYMFVSV